MFSLDMLDCPMYSLSLSTWNFLCWMGWGDHSKSVLLFGFLCGTLPSCLKVGGWWWWVVGSGGLQDFSVSPGSESLSLSLSKSLSHWAWVWAWLSLSAWAEPELDKSWYLANKPMYIFFWDKLQIFELCDSVKLKRTEMDPFRLC